MATVRINAKIPPDLADALKREALKTDRTLSAEIRTALRAHLAPKTSEGARPGAPAKTSGSGPARHEV